MNATFISILALSFFATTGLAGGLPSASTALPHGGRLSCVAHTGSTSCEVSFSGGASKTFNLKRDTDESPSTDIQIEVVAVTTKALVFTDSYNSKAQGLHRCQAGEERFLRWVALDRAKPRTFFQTKLESCTDDVSLALDGLVWNETNHTLSVHWLSGPGSGTEQRKTLKIE